MKIEPGTVLPCRVGPADRFFPGKHAHRDMVNAVKAECGPCPILDACREWAVEVDEKGIWGGTTEKERRDIRNARGIKPHPIVTHIYNEDRADAVRSLVARGYTPGEVAVALRMSPSAASQAVAKAKRRAS